MGYKKLRILLVEDNAGDVFLFKAALAEIPAEIDLLVFENGFYAWQYLEKVAGGEAPKPDLIVLDLNLPGMDGRQILAEMTTRPELHKLPVCVFTGAGSEEVILHEHPRLKLCFYTKVDTFNNLRDIIKSFIEFAAADSGGESI